MREHHFEYRIAPWDDGGQRLLDVAGGTGDIAFRFLERAPMAQCTVLDMTESMLLEGQKRAEAQRQSDKLDWIVGDAMALPFEDNTFEWANSVGLDIGNEDCTVRNCLIAHNENAGIFYEI